jgi:hypothetical protein
MRAKSLEKGKGSSSNNHSLNYLKPLFWSNPDNHFWESEKYTEKAKEYYRRSVKRFEREIKSFVI